MYGEKETHPPSTLGDRNYNYWHLHQYLWKKLLMHEYLAKSGNSLTYKNCVYCFSRKSTICVKCNFCYSCHYVIERLESYSKQTPVRIINAKRDKNEKKFRGSKFEANFVVYSIKK
jgi:hypothetical protein